MAARDQRFPIIVHEYAFSHRIIGAIAPAHAHRGGQHQIAKGAGWIHPTPWCGSSG